VRLRHRKYGVLCLIPALVSLSLVAAAPQGSLPAPAVPDGLGVNIHFTDPRPGEIDMLADAGFHWVRMDFMWSATERERGKYDFTAYERLLAALAPRRLHAMFILEGPKVTVSVTRCLPEPCSKTGLRAAAPGQRTVSIA